MKLINPVYYFFNISARFWLIVGKFFGREILNEKAEISIHKWILQFRSQISTPEASTVSIPSLWVIDDVLMNRIFYRKHVQNGLIAQKEILMRGYKYFSRVSAVGETTAQTLKTLSKSTSSKFIHRFQFDP